MEVVRLWHVSPQGKRRLFNTIDAASLFFGFRQPKEMWKQENQIKCAEILRDGWIASGQYPGTWEIEIGKSDPVVFSKETDRLLKGERDEVF